MMQNFFLSTETTASKGRSEGKRVQENNTKDESRHVEIPQHSAQSVSTTREESEVIEVKADGPVVSASEPTTLFSLISKRNWKGVVNRCRGDETKEAMTWVMEKNRDNTIRWKLLPIHQACENKAPSEVIKALVAAFPDSLLVKDNDGSLPIHLACRERCSRGVIKVLLSEEPATAKIRDGEGRLPLHLACRQGTVVQVIDSLIICFFRGIRTPDAYDLLPIHWACAQNASVSVVEALLHALPDSVDLKDKWGRTPLSLAHASTNPDKEGVIEALSQDPSYWNTHLVEEIEVLRQKLEESNHNENNSESRLKELKDENDKLKEEVRLLSSANMFSDEDLEQMNQEKVTMKKDIGNFKYKLAAYKKVFESMDQQRQGLLKVTQDMEKSINTVSYITSDLKSTSRNIQDKTRRSNSAHSQFMKKSGTGTSDAEFHI